MTLISTLNAEFTVKPFQMVVFTCTARVAGVLNWFSDEYIGTDGLPLQIIGVGNTTTARSNTDPNTVAVRISVTDDNGVIVIVSELRIIISIQYLMATVSCDNGDRQLRQSISFSESKSMVCDLPWHNMHDHTQNFMCRSICMNTCYLICMQS